MFYTVKAFRIFRTFYPPGLTWEKPTKDKVLYLTFDDGPHPIATPFILEKLEQYHAKATFFCIGKNVTEYPGIYRRILDKGHKAGNHTHNHLDGWKTDNKKYFENIFEAAKYIDSDLFRPPYGRINRFQAKVLKGERERGDQGGGLQHGIFRIIMWSVLSGDFDVKLSPERCVQNVVLSSKPGSIIVFHDSTKAWDRMSYALPRMLEHFSSRGFEFRSL